MSPRLGQSEILEGRERQGAAGASEEVIARLRGLVPATIPESYFSFLRFSNGGEGPLPIHPLWLCLYPVDEVIEIAQAGTFSEFFPGLFVIGSNGSGEAVAFDLRGAEPPPLVYFDMVNIDVAESVCTIAPTFDVALQLIGRA